MSDKYIFNVGRSLAEVCLNANSLEAGQQIDDEYKARFLECVNRQLEIDNQVLFKTHFYNQFKVKEPDTNKLPSVNAWFAEEE